MSEQDSAPFYHTLHTSMIEGRRVLTVSRCPLCTFVTASPDSRLVAFAEAIRTCLDLDKYCRVNEQNT